MRVQTENANIIMAGGVESMSTAELYIRGDIIKWGMGGVGDMPRGHVCLRYS